MKRQRPSSPPPSSFSAQEPLGDEPPRPVKRVRFAAPDAWNRAARLQTAKYSSNALERNTVVEWQFGTPSDSEFDDADEPPNSSDASEEDDDPASNSSGARGGPLSNPSPYESINSVLWSLNQSRAHNQRQKTPLAVPPPVSAKVSPPVPQDVASLAKRGSPSPKWLNIASEVGREQRRLHAPAAVQKHASAIPSRLRFEVTGTVEPTRSAPDDEDWESEAVRLRYEETNR